MTISPLLIYLIDVCHSLCELLNVLFVLSLALIFFILFIRDEFDIDEIKQSLKDGILKWAFIVLVISTLGCLFVPSKNTLIQMLVIPPIVNNEQIQELPANVLNFVNDYLKEVGKKEKDL